MRAVCPAAAVTAADVAAAQVVGEAVLIERASWAVATVAGQLLDGLYGRAVLVLAGSGHNGADALRAGALLARRGCSVTAVRSSSRAGDEHVAAAWAALLAAGGRERAAVLPPGHPSRSPELVIDGMTGGGFAGALSGRAAELVAEVAQLRVLAVDLPSGVVADTGAALGAAIRAEATVTFAALRPAHVVGQGVSLSGTVVVADIGIHPERGSLGVLDADDIVPLLAVPGPDSDKYSRGVVGIHAGGAAYPGAAVLATGGAVRAGAGYVRYLGTATDAVLAAWPTVVAGAGRVDALVIGPGLAGTHDDLAAVRAALASDTPLLLDAGALAVGADALRGRTAPTLITPHAGEFSRLTGVDPRGDPLGAARDAAADLGVHVLLKGQCTVIAAPDGRARINPTATTWLSTAGSGDVLSGACGALLAAAVKRASRNSAGTPLAPGLAQGLAPGLDPDLLTVAAAAAFLHGLAGRYAPVPLAASDLLNSWAQAVAAVRSTE